MTVRAEILKAMSILQAKDGRDTFSLKEITQQVLSQTKVYKKSSIGTHIVSSMCVNAPENHLIRYPDLIRVGYGLYKLDRT